MAVGGDVGTEKRFMLPISGITLTISQGNIIETSARSIATGEDRNIMGYGAVSELLLKVCPKAYKSARDQMKRDNSGKFEPSKVYPCSFPNPHSGGKKGVSFSIVLHAIVPSAGEVTREKEWMDKMKTLYYNLFKQADSHGKVSLALPLLGSGVAGATTEAATDVLAHTLVTFKRDNRESRHILKDIIVYTRNEAFSMIVSKVTKQLKSFHQTNGLGAVAPSSVGIGSARPSRSRKPSQATDASRIGSATSGHAHARAPRSKAKAAAGAVSAAKSKVSSPATDEDDNSNLAFILGGMTLKGCPNGASAQQEHEEEDMDWENGDSCEDEVEERDDEDEAEEDEEADKCAICLEEMDNPKKLDKCGHAFCKECIEDSFKHHKPACPTCNTMYGLITGNQPQGTMSMRRDRHGLPGYQNYGMLIISYEFSSGIQGKEHPNPGLPYRGTHRQAFLPDCDEGRKVYRLLRVAFDNRLTFTVGRSRTTGAENVVTWNDIHHKTSIEGGSTGFGYPDPHYLSRVQEELAAKGVTEECLKGRVFDI